MKDKKEYRSRYQFNLAMNEEEYTVLKILMEDFSINISGCFKRFLIQYLEQLKKVNSDSKNGKI